jgi:hypothetical protein
MKNLSITNFVKHLTCASIVLLCDTAAVRSETYLCKMQPSWIENFPELEFFELNTKSLKARFGSQESWGKYLAVDELGSNSGRKFSWQTVSIRKKDGMKFNDHYTILFKKNGDYILSNRWRGNDGSGTDVVSVECKQQ